MTSRLPLFAAALTAALVACDARPARPGASTADAGAVATAHALQAPAALGASGAVEEQTFRFDAFGTVHVLHAGAAPLAGATPAHTIVFAAGDAGWDANGAALARRIAGSGDVLVIGVDGAAYLRREMRGHGCASPDGDFEAVSQYTQHRLGLARYTPPVLVGDGSGAALAYASLAQAPRGTFPGAIALGLPAMFASARPFCGPSHRPALGARGGTGFTLLPERTLRLPVAFLTPTTGVAGGAAASVAQFAHDIPGASVVSVPGGSAFAGSEWVLPFTQALERIAPATPAPVHASGGAGSAGANVADLPLVEIAPAAGAGGPADLVAIILSGDGGWASIDREVGETLAAGGVPVVGLNTLQYFWTPRTPDGAAADLARIVAHATAAPPGGGTRPRVVLIGYSRGADVLPFMARRLAPDLRAHVAGVAFLGLEPSIAFEFHVSDWLGGESSNEKPTLPEVAALRAELPAAVPILCLYGTGEDDSACPAAARQSGARAIAMPGGHHLGGDYPALARQILAALH